MVTSNQVTEMATTAGAASNRILDKVGTLTPGQEADIIVLDARSINTWPMNSVPGTIVTMMNPRHVRDVLIAGEVVYRKGRLVRTATTSARPPLVNDPANMSAFDRAALERDEQFNTRISGYIGWEQAARKLIPTPRHAARFDLTRMVVASGSKTTAEAVDYLLWRLLRVPTANPTRNAFVSFLTGELGTDSIERARSYMEDGLRMTVHLIMSTPEYQIV